ncbi:MAG: type III polyketide synthase [Caldilineaceae bacterium]|nr:type III polyketide synthase [Caldilineaceae bacterium]
MPILDRPAILALGTAVPAHVASQETVYRWMADSFADHPTVVRWLRALYAYSGIERRHICIDDFLRPPTESNFAPGQPLAEIATTAQRMEIYERESAPLALEAATQALSELAAESGCSFEAAARSITHLITISCTGFFAPGLDLALARRLRLSSNIGRTMIGFMGCSAMFNGLRTAHQIVQGDPSARVLVVSVELCSIHVQPGTKRENLISASLFADGSSACVVGRPRVDQHNCFVLEDLRTEVKANTEEEMVWQIGDYGFELKLSPRIPKHLGEVAPSILADLFPKHMPDFCAIHPGGPAILDELESILKLDPAKIEASRRVLSNYGNISSATILFVLDDLRRTMQTPQTGVAMAFGPGLTVEMVRMTYQPKRVYTNGHHTDGLPLTELRTAQSV